MYVALAFSNQVSVLDPQGNEIARFGGGVTDPNNPFANPSGIAFNGRGSILVTNHAIFDPTPAEKFAVFDIWVGDQGDRLERP
jgi:DNA-binding beta-propeller fold protein YncE